MLRIVLFLLSACSFFPQNTSGNTFEQRNPRYRIRAYSNLYEVRVVDDRGNLVKAIPQERFIVLESGERRQIAYFEEVDATPVSLGILIDTGSSSSKQAILSAKAAVFELIHQLEPGDEILLGVYENDVHFLSELTSERVDLMRSLENVSPGGRIGFFSRLSHAFASSGHTGWAIDRTLMRLKESRHNYKVMLVFSAALGSIGPATQEHLRIAGARLFVVTWKNRAGDAFNFWGDRTAGKRAVRVSGGIYFPGQQVLEQIDQLRDSFKCFYLIAYEPLHGEGGGEDSDPDIRIRDHPDWQVHAVRRTAAGYSTVY